MITHEFKNFPFIIITFILVIFSSVILLLPIQPLYWLILVAGLIFIFVSLLTVGIREGLLYLLVFIIPFHLGKFYIYPDEPSLWIGIRIIDFVILSLYILWVAEILGRRVTEKVTVSKSASLFLFFLVLLSFVSCLNAVDKKQCIYQSLILLRGFLIFFYIAHYPIKKQTLKTILFILIAGALIQSIIAFIQWHTGSPLGLEWLGEPLKIDVQRLRIQSVFRITGTLPSPNMLWFMYMDFVLPLLAALLLFRMKILYKIVIFTIFVFCFFVCNLTFSRGGLISFFTGMGALLFLNLLKARFSMKMLIRSFFIITLSLITLFFMADMILSRFTSYDYGSLAMRVPLMQIALNIVFSHPLLGIGAGNYILVMYLYDVSVSGITSFFFYQVHNLYLLIAAEMGIFALGAFLLFIFSVLKKGWSSLIKKSEGIASVVTMGLVSGLFAFSVHGLVESISLGRLLMLWFCCGLIVNLGRTSRFSGWLT
ncbi:MAG: O-antigen ligase family protein [Candidatus Omnitrophica bacterium]|nr:O-antigen ligase family protein [Candidatus Omnitrophota bacterium]